MFEAPDLVYWASTGNLDQVKQLLEAHVDASSSDQEGYSALHAAAENGYPAIVEALIERGAVVNAVVNDMTSLDLAMLSNNKEVAVQLRARGAILGRDLT